jgi:hypothetical protein
LTSMGCTEAHGPSGVGVGVAPARKVPERTAPRLDPAKSLIDVMLREDLTAPRKHHGEPPNRNRVTEVRRCGSALP